MITNAKWCKGMTRALITQWAVAGVVLVLAVLQLRPAPLLLVAGAAGLLAMGWTYGHAHVCPEEGR